MDNRIITTDVMEEDFSLEGNLRPQTLDEYIGQEKTKNTLKVYIEAAKQRHCARGTLFSALVCLGLHRRADAKQPTYFVTLVVAVL